MTEARLVKLFFLTFLLIPITAWGQNRTIDTGELDKWQKITPLASISADGRYVAYELSGRKSNDNTVVLKATGDNWQYQVRNGHLPVFSRDGRTAVIGKNDSLQFIKLSNKKMQFVSVSSYRFSSRRDAQWLAYEFKGRQKAVLINLTTNRSKTYDNVVSFNFDEGAHICYLVRRKKNATELLAIELPTQRVKTIWTGTATEKPENFKFYERTGDCLFLLINGGQKTVWHYRHGWEKAELKLTNTDPRLAGYHMSGSLPRFSTDGNWIIIEKEKLSDPSHDSLLSGKSLAPVDIWGYRDKINSDSGDSQLLLSVKDEHSFELPSGTTIAGNELQTKGNLILLTEKDTTGQPDPLKDLTYPDRLIAYSMLTGKRTFITGYKFANDVTFSPDGNYVIYYNTVNGIYYSYSFRSGQTFNLSSGTGTSFCISNYNRSEAKAPEPIAGFYQDRVLVYDNYDLWALGLTDKLPPLNLTHSFGRNHQIKFRLLKQYSVGLTNNTTALLIAFDTKTKANGFYQFNLGENADPKILSMDACLYFRSGSQTPPSSQEFSNGMQPVKAANVGRWLVMRQTASDAPNLFCTNDFQSFTPLTDEHPQEPFNWITSELIGYKLEDGAVSQGILYKPEHFDSAKKYPLIVNCYELLSDRLHEFPLPEWTDANINIPYFVSRGYLVFTPDIFYEAPSAKTNKTAGQSALESITAAVRKLGLLPFVDNQRLGIQGQSFGGFETNYLISHCKLFKAAAEMAGPTDLTSAYLNLLPSVGSEIDGRENDFMWVHEIGQDRIGVTLWERQDLYHEMSPVLNADRIITPLLMVHNKKDFAVHYRQGVEMYRALRRLSKPCWLLQYDGGTHALYPNSKEAKDYTIRLTQFFDHYLKGTPPPAWMTTQSASGYALDPKGSCGPNCDICKLKNYEK